MATKKEKIVAYIIAVPVICLYLYDELQKIQGIGDMLMFPFHIIFAICGGMAAILLILGPFHLIYLFMKWLYDED